ncbi:DUF3060 domain-containing protein [Chryseobacterium sp. D764]|jgi:hypothetical protein|uniref:DUF3060 domain-containing protein n=1 Tax=unclassified Chryseobacterium TaxID=2593645 RepID=UPI000984E22E|nr:MULTISPECIES: DUF3060 domain-containing protein [unclassified Chryseobacterium]QXU51271.1 DUF3060 domain-containing protein [Chryseobacterium sp. D764]CAD0220829.1 conserved exported protein of unknown function [Chryseobacterium sp. JV274]
MKNIKTAGILAFLLLGTGTAFSQSRKIESAKGVEKTEGNKVVHVEGVGHNLNYTLNGGVVEVEGGDNTLTVKGSAKKITVSGTGNKVYIDKVDKISMEGGDNMIYYRTSGTKSGKPDVSITGVGNKVVKQ